MEFYEISIKIYYPIHIPIILYYPMKSPDKIQTSRPTPEVGGLQKWENSSPGEVIGSSRFEGSKDM